MRSYEAEYVGGLWHWDYHHGSRKVVTAQGEEETGVRLCQHGNDPPIPVYRGIPHVLNSFAAFDRLFREFPSSSNGMTYCVGTRYESGEDVLAGIAHFGPERIFNVHFRNVIGPIPARGEYLETFLDDGDMDMGAVVAALEAAGYDGVLNIDHIPILDIEQEWTRSWRPPGRWPTPRPWSPPPIPSGAPTDRFRRSPRGGPPSRAHLFAPALPPRLRFRG